MIFENLIPGPVLFNPLKHHLGFIREFMLMNAEPDPEPDQKILIKELKHLGTSVMDVYTGSLKVSEICTQIIAFLKERNLASEALYSEWTGTKARDLRIVQLSDDSQWTLKYYDNSRRFVHIFPSRGSSHSFRVKSNTLKSAILYYILIGKDFITGDDLNKVRPLLGLSPVKDPVDTRAITEMIEILRNDSI